MSARFGIGIAVVGLIAGWGVRGKEVVARTVLSDALEYSEVMIAISSSKDPEEKDKDRYRVEIRQVGFSGVMFFDGVIAKIPRGKGLSERERHEASLVDKVAKYCGIGFDASKYKSEAFEASVLTCLGKNGWEVYSRSELNEGRDGGQESRVVTMHLKRAARP